MRKIVNINTTSTKEEQLKDLITSIQQVKDSLVNILDEYVFDRYAAEDSGWICCFVSDRVPVAECGKLYF